MPDSAHTLTGPGSQGSEVETAVQTSFPFQKWIVTHLEQESSSHQMQRKA